MLAVCNGGVFGHSLWVNSDLTLDGERKGKEEAGGFWVRSN